MLTSRLMAACVVLATLISAVRAQQGGQQYDPSGPQLLPVSSKYVFIESGLCGDKVGRVLIMSHEECQNAVATSDTPSQNNAYTISNQAPRGCALKNSAHHNTLYVNDVTHGAKCGPVNSFKWICVCKLECPSGTYMSGKECKECSHGMYNADVGQTKCTSCGVGRYSQVNGANAPSSCRDCPEGFWNDHHTNGNCKLCGKGRYGTSTGARSHDVCKTCFNAYNDEKGQSACMPCAGGKYNSKSESAVSQLANGQSTDEPNFDEAADCQASCSTGTYKPASQLGPCLVCSSGFFQADTGQEQCRPCVAGTYQDVTTVSRNYHDEASDCQVCPAGRYNDKTGQDGSASQVCTLCAAGTFIPSTATLSTLHDSAGDCNACGAGTYSPQTRARCTICPEGYFNEKLAQETCEACAVGKFNYDPAPLSISRHDKESDCTQCQAGTWSDQKHAKACTTCTKGRYNTDIGQTSSTACLECPKGRVNYYTSTYPPRYFDELTDCRVCSGGRYNNKTGAGSYTDCQRCRPGRYNDDNSRQDATKHDDESDCVQCEKDTFSTRTGRYSPCDACPEGKYTAPDSTHDKLTECKSCQPGSAISAGENACTPCALGKYSTNGDTCIACDAGKFSNTPGASSCKTCQPGYFQASSSGSACTPCALGRFLKTASGTSCDVCPNGRRGNPTSAVKDSEAAACQDCTPGRFARDGGQTTCVACEVGFFQPNSGRDDCQRCISAAAPGATECEGAGCPSGTFGTGPPNCQSCEAGQFSVKGLNDAECEKCPTGFYGVDSKFKCTACPSGKWSDLPAGDGKDESTACQKCATGKHGTSALGSMSEYSACRKCPKGTFSAEIAAASISSCVQCSLGQWAADEGRSEPCQSCSGGRYVAVTGWSDPCLFCPIGFAQSAAKAASCGMCVTGKIQAQTGQNECMDCSPGSVAPTMGADECIECPRGYAQAEAGQGSCLPCFPGRVGPEKQMTVCVLCQTGRFMDASASAADECKQCPSGYYQDASERMSCKQCMPGRFAVEIGGSNCGLCAAHTYSILTNQSCATCPSGYQAPSQGSAFCTNCESGSVSQAGKSCSRCAAGKFARAASACEDCPAGFAQSQDGRGACVKCKSGTYNSGEAGLDCDSCKMNEYTDEFVEIKQACLQCPTGYDTDEKTGMSYCSRCRAGFYADTAGKTCGKCEPGRYRGEDNDEKSCIKCSPGRSQSNSGQSSCTRCYPGTFSPSKGGATCGTCPNGWTQPEAEQDHCNMPPPSKIAIEGGAATIDVTEGWRKDNCAIQGNSTICQYQSICAAGRFGVEDRSKCELCPAGTTSSVGSFMGIMCTSCPKGTFAPEFGSPECESCNTAHRKYSDEIGAVSCKQCNTSEISTGKGCEAVAADNRILVPKFQNDGAVFRAASNKDGHDLVQINFAFSSKDWDASTKLGYRVVAFDVDVSTDKEFPETASSTYHIHSISVDSLNTTSATQIDDQIDSDPIEENALARLGQVQSEQVWRLVLPTVSDVPMCQRPVYVRVRAVGEGSKWGAWGAVSKSWKNLAAKDCREPNEYVDCHSEADTTRWECAPCPPGAWCKGSIAQEQIKANQSFWRDDRPIDDNAGAEGLVVPFDQQFVQCPNSMACSGSLQAESCNETLGYLDMCCSENTTAGGQPCGRCRRCQTCKQGYSMDYDGFTCAPCPESSAGLVFMSFFVFFVIVLVFGGLVYLKVRNYTSSSESAQSKSAHVTVKRILLSHMQVVMLCMQLNVPWPPAIQTMMNVFSSMSSLSNHLSALSCLFFVDESPVRKQAKFLYATTQFVMTFPLAFAVFIWLYWLVLVPLKHCKCLSCGKSSKLYMSDPRPGCLKKKNETRVNRRRASGGFTAAQGSNLDLSVLLKTRDVWVYSMMLYFCE